jgi:hypothetical protein
MNTLEAAVTDELVITAALAAAAIAARPEGVLIVALPGVPEESVLGWTKDPPVPARVAPPLPGDLTLKDLTRE